MARRDVYTLNGKNLHLQGDVVALIDANGTQMVEYGYDARGNPISKTGSLAATIGTLNPFRYRGYTYLFY